jgi:predicted acetyltransferase
MALLADIQQHDPPNADFYAPAKVDFAAYVQSLLDEEQGLGLREGWVPCSHRWLFSNDGKLVAVTRIRHNISTPFLAENGGHIGYDVAPSHRGLGYGHAALQASLAEARRLGIARVLLFTGADNAASRRIIERQGGQLDSISYSEFWGEMLCKYWINVAQG